MVLKLWDEILAIIETHALLGVVCLFGYLSGNSGQINVGLMYS